jgi:tetratricopeptide (TPR) repeat protein
MRQVLMPGRTRFSVLAAVSTLTILLDPLVALGQDHDHGQAGVPAERLGKVTFPVSCTAEAQERFERAMALLHSFWWSEAEKAFDHVLEADSRCAMAHWGLAMAHRGNPFGPPPADGPRKGFEAATRAAALNAPTERERAFIAAVGELWRDHQTVDLRQRSLAYEAAMQRAHELYPEDPEVAIYYAFALTINAPATDLTFERQGRAGRILEPLFARYPDHPGLAHYLIHTYDSPRLAQLGIEAARKYQEIAPDVPHAQHMPSHIFTRLGLWEESIAANAASAASARAYEEAQGLQAASMDRVHAWDYLVYAYLQRGRDAEAMAVLREASAVSAAASHIAVHYALAAIPARYALERGEWGRAAALAIRSSPEFPAGEAITHYARGVGAMRTGQVAAATEALRALTEVRDTLRARNDAYWAQLVEAQRLGLSAWVAYGKGDALEAERNAREAAELEESLEKHPITPGPVLPARELHGELLLEMGRAADAQAAFERALEREPNRARSLFGAARSAQMAGNADAARRHYAAWLEQMSAAAPGRPEIATARGFLANP